MSDHIKIIQETHSILIKILLIVIKLTVITLKKVGVEWWCSTPFCYHNLIVTLTYKQALQTSLSYKYEFMFIILLKDHR